jgi:hypothetical protein
MRSLIFKMALIHLNNEPKPLWADHYSFVVGWRVGCGFETLDL